MSTGKSSYAAARYFASRDKCAYDAAVFRHWFANKEQILSGSDNQRIIKGGGSKPLLGSLE